MSIIQTIRDKGSWVMFVLLALALISFIFMDAGRRDSIFGRGGGNKNIGSVNGSSLKTETFAERADALRKVYADNAQVTEEQIRSFVWNSMVNEKLMKNELDKVGFSMSEKDLVDFALGKYGQPNQHVIPFFNHYFKGSGIVDEQSMQLNAQLAERAYRQYLRKPNGANNEAVSVFKTLLGMVRNEFLLARQGQMMANTVYVPLWMAKRQMADNNTLANISYVNIPYTDVSDSLPEVKVTDEDLVKYMQKNPLMYQQEENRTIDYTIFDFKPTESDSNSIRETLLTKKEELRNIKDSLAGNFVTSNNTATPYTDQYVRKAALQIKGDSTGFVQGAVYGPYLDEQKRYNIAKITAVRSMPDTVSARHILIQTFDPRAQQYLRDDATALAMMDTVRNLYRSGTISFDSLAKRYSDDGGSKDSGGLYKAIGLNQFAPEFNEFIFTKNVGDTGVVKTIYGYHFIQLTGKKGADAPAYKVAYLTKSIEPSQNTRDSVYGEATKFAASARTAAAFDDYFVKNPGKLTKLNSKEINRSSVGVDIFQRARDLVRWTFKAKLGDVSEPMVMDAENKIVVAKLSSISPEGLLSAKNARQALEITLRNNKKYDYLVKKYGTGASLEEIATKTGKQVMTRDSLSFETASFVNLATEPRVAGASLNPAYQTKISGPIKGNSGVFYIKVNGQPYAKAAAVTDPLIVRQAMLQEAKRNSYSNESPFRRGAKVKDKRLDVGY